MIDLGHQPPSNAYLDRENLNKPENYYPLKVFVCTSCWLVQIPEYANAEKLFNDDYSYLSSTSQSWSLHAKEFAYYVIKKLDLNEKSSVLEIASNDGYLLKHFVKHKIPSIGIEPTKICANLSRKKGIDTREEFFNLRLAEKLAEEKKFDLIIANNVLAHVPDLNDFIKGIHKVLKPDGFVSIEFPHLLQIIRNNQFDTIYHEHYSYFSLNVVKRIVSEYGLEVVDVEELTTHGGSLRVWLGHYGKFNKSKNIEKIISEETQSELENLNAYSKFQENAYKIKASFLKYLISKKESNTRVIGYGAAAKGNTLINYCGVKNDLIEFVVDRALSKQGKFLPGSHIPIVSEEKLTNLKTKELIIFPWNLINELKIQLKDFDLITFIPNIKKW
jgi:SAM-dependent methyltransferase